jgi:ribonuclease III
MSSIEEVIGYEFDNRDYLKEALTHKSYSSEMRGTQCNERLEFLGDSVLGLVVTSCIFLNNPGSVEGNLSKLKSRLVSKTSLAKWANDIDLGQHLLLGHGELTSGGRQRESILANAMEALIGAIYLDGGFESAEKFVKEWVIKAGEELSNTDYKSVLQEAIQKKYKITPDYEITQTVGPEHDKTFTVSVRLRDKLLAKGKGKNKKEAQQEAAKNALDKFRI